MLAIILAHWKDIVMAIIAVDVALMPIFPQAGILGKIKEMLQSLVG